MKRAIGMAVIILQFLVIRGVVSGQAPAVEGFIPSWEAGQAWRMSIFYTLWSVGETEPGAGQSVELNFIIEGKNGAGEGFWVIRVSGEGNGRSIKAALLYRAEDFSLAEAEMESVFRGKIVREVLTFPPGKPAISKFGEIPLDQPVFPLEVPSRQSFETEREIGEGLKVREKVVQVVRNVPGRPSGTAFEVICEDGEGRMIFRQVWEKGRPWAVEGRSEGMRYEMVRP